MQKSFRASFEATLFSVNSLLNNSSGDIPWRFFPVDGRLFSMFTIKSSKIVLNFSNGIILPALISPNSFSGLSTTLPPLYPTLCFDNNSFIFKKSRSIGFVWALYGNAKWTLTSNSANIERVFTCVLSTDITLRPPAKSLER